MLSLEKNGRIYNGEKMEKKHTNIKELDASDIEKQIGVTLEREEFDIIDNKFEHILNQYISLLMVYYMFYIRTFFSLPFPLNVYSVSVVESSSHCMPSLVKDYIL